MDQCKQIAAPAAVPVAIPANAGNGKPVAAGADHGAGRILELDPAMVFTPESNRTIPLDSISGLVESLKQYGQLVLGIVVPHPDKVGCWLCLDGNRRLMASRLLGVKFKAAVHKGKITPGALAATRIAANRTQKRMTDDELAADLAAVMEEENITQGEAAKRCGLSPSEASKALKYQERAVPEVKQAVADKIIVRDTARAISTVPAEQQKDLLERAIKLGMSSDAVEIVASQARRKKSKCKSVKVSLQGITLLIELEDLQKVFAVMALIDGGLKRIEKFGLPLASLPSMLRG